MPARAASAKGPPANGCRRTYRGTWDAVRLAVTHHLADPEDHKLRRLDHGHADLDHDAPRIPHFGRIRGLVAADVKRLLRLAAKQRAVPPHERQKRRHVAHDLRPEAPIVGF